MGEQTRKDIRKLLKQFGVQADEAITAHLERLPDDRPLEVRITLEDITDYGASSPDEALHLEIEGQIR
jgi:hypothetical protein